jgi:dTDP-4-amino-4,6-dideoxygalactose transaminase
MKPYDIVDAFEKRVAEYAGAKYGVAVNSCTNALLLSLLYRFWQGYGRTVLLPKHTYVGVAQSVINAGGKCVFHDYEWEGVYSLFCKKGEEFVTLDIFDSARRFRRYMYKGGLWCLSFHWYKHLPIGRGGMILTDNKQTQETLQQMRYDGRRLGEHGNYTRGYHCTMVPEDAARGLMLMNSAVDYYDDLPADGYDDLSQYDLFKGDV